MRKIEQEMLNAYDLGKNWSSGNTMVNNEGTIYLHGNRIAFVENGRLTVDLETLRHWPTSTTRSRLRALGFKIKGYEVIK